MEAAPLQLSAEIILLLLLVEAVEVGTVIFWVVAMQELSTCPESKAAE